MDQLWAPWRIGYVSQPDKQADGCFLCTAAGGEDDRENLVLWRNRHCFCVMNRWPYNNGHLLIAPLEHKADFAELTEEEIAGHMRMLRRCQKALKVTVDPGGFNIGLNLGAAAGAGLADHLHWHIVPRWHGDTNFMLTLADTRVIPQSLEHLWELLRELG